MPKKKKNSKKSSGGGGGGGGSCGGTLSGSALRMPPAGLGMPTTEGLHAGSSPLDFMRATGFDVDGMQELMRRADGDQDALAREFFASGMAESFTRNSMEPRGCLADARALEQRADATWLCWHAEEAATEEDAFTRYTFVTEVVACNSGGGGGAGAGPGELGFIMAALLSDGRKEGEEGRDHDLLACLVQACCDPSKPIELHEPCRPGTVLFDQALLPAAGCNAPARARDRLGVAVAPAPEALLRAARQRQAERSSPSSGMMPGGLTPEQLASAAAAAVHGVEPSCDASSHWAPGAITRGTGIPPSWYARPAECPWIGDAILKDRMMWGWRSELEEAVRAGDAPRVDGLLDRVVLRHGRDALVEFAEARDLLAKLVKAAFFAQGSDAGASQQTVGERGIPPELATAGPCLQAGMYAAAAAAAAGACPRREARKSKHSKGSGKKGKRARGVADSGAAAAAAAAPWKPWPLPEQPDFVATLRHLLARSVPADAGARIAGMAELEHARSVGGCNGESALYSCAVLGKVALAELLLVAGADPHHTDTEGITPAFMTAVNGQLAVLELMVRLGGADVRKPIPRDGNTLVALVEQQEGREERGVSLGFLQPHDCEFHGPGRFADQLRAMLEVTKWKAVGNALLRRGRLDEAARAYETARETDAFGHMEHLLCSNLCLVATRRGDLERAVELAKRTVELEPRWRKGALRLADALRRASEAAGASEADASKQAAAAAAEFVQEARSKRKGARFDVAPAAPAAASGGAGALSSESDSPATCGLCGKLDTERAFKKCSACKVQIYCSTACQKADWKSHKRRCKQECKGR
jgi:hypothetical protein